MGLSLFFLSCSGGGGGGGDSTSSTSTVPVFTSNYAVLGPLSNADVKIYRISDNALAYSGKTTAFTNETQIIWPDNRVGAFSIDINSSFSDSDLMLVIVSGGEDIDPNDDGIVNTGTFRSLQGEVKAIAELSELRAKTVQISIFSTMAVLNVDLSQTRSQILSTLNSYAQNIFRGTGVDYTDLNSYTPNLTDDNVLNNPNIYTQLLNTGILDSILDDTNLTALLSQDIDGDTLTLEEELFAGTDDNDADSDNDTLTDDFELANGLNPLLADTDFDGLRDDVELASGTSSPTNSDSDGDYFPDGVDANINDPDANSNGILDGLDGDPFFSLQWHLKSNGTVVNNINNISTIVGNDLGMLDVYHSVIGKDGATVIQVVDTGVELAHEDLQVDTSRSYNAVNHTNDPTQTTAVGSDKNSPLAVGHGTAVAGIVAAKANNGFGLRGVIPNAFIAGSNWLENQSIDELEMAWYNTPNGDDILVSNNSWGSYFSDDTTLEAILKLSSDQLRGGKGRSFVFAAGNDRGNFGNANLSYITNNRYAITVAALNHENKFASYSNAGSNILVSAYGGEFYQEAPTIATTTLSGEAYFASELSSDGGTITVDADTSRNYTYAMNGTSSASPMVTGSVALLLEACPSLTWRDVKWLIARNATKVDSSNSAWVKNAAGLSHNINYGYGRINTLAMIQECRSPYYKLLGNEVSASASRSNLNLNIPDSNTLVSTFVDFSSSFVVEWVELTFKTNHTYAGDLEVRLISPRGTFTQLILPNGLSSNQYANGFRFSSAAFIGETSSGQWRVEVIDRLTPDSGTLENLTLKIYGH